MGWWQMWEQTFSELTGLALLQSGLMTTSSSGLHESTCLVTTHSTQSGRLKSRPREATGRRVAGSGMAGRCNQMAHPKNFMKTAAWSSVTWRALSSTPLMTRGLPMQMWTLMDSQQLGNQMGSLEIDPLCDRGPWVSLGLVLTHSASPPREENEIFGSYHRVGEQTCPQSP